MAKHQSPGIATRYSDRDRKATPRFAEGWYSVNLPRLSSALGVGATEASRGDYATRTEGEASRRNDDNGFQTIEFGMCHEIQISDVVEEEEEANREIVAVCASAPRRSERERKVTKRFEEGWFGEWLPRLSAALGWSGSEKCGR